jgi:hypothetical protein
LTARYRISIESRIKVSHHTLIEILLIGRGIVRTPLIEFLLKAEENQAAKRNSFDRKGKSLKCTDRISIESRGKTSS